MGPRHRDSIEEAYVNLIHYRFLKSPQASTAKLDVPKDYSERVDEFLDLLIREISTCLNSVVKEIEHCDGITVHTLIDCLNHVQLFSGKEFADLKLGANRRKAALLQNQALGGEPIGQLPFYELALDGEINPPEACRRRDTASRQPSPANSASDISSEAGGASVLYCSNDSRNLLQKWPISDGAIWYILKSSLHWRYPNRKHRRRSISSEAPPEFLAFTFGTPQQAQSWLSNPGDVVELEDIYGRRISHVAAQFGKAHLLENIIKDPTYKSKLDCLDARKLSPAMVAVIHGDLEALKLFIEADYRTDGRDLQGRNLLALAARHGFLEIVKHLLDIGLFQVNDLQGAGRSSAIQAAMDANREDITGELQRHNVVLSVNFAGMDASSYAQEVNPSFTGFAPVSTINSMSRNDQIPQYSRHPNAAIGPPPVQGIADQMAPGTFQPFQYVDNPQDQYIQPMPDPYPGPLEPPPPPQQSQYQQYQHQTTSGPSRTQTNFSTLRPGSYQSN